jgi:hypothetical protein
MGVIEESKYQTLSRKPKDNEDNLLSNVEGNNREVLGRRC